MAARDPQRSLREILSVASGTDETAHERVYHVSALGQANTSAHSPWVTAQSTRRPLRRLERALVACRRCRKAICLVVVKPHEPLGETGARSRGPTLDRACVLVCGSRGPRADRQRDAGQRVNRRHAQGALPDPGDPARRPRRLRGSPSARRGRLVMVSPGTGRAESNSSCVEVGASRQDVYDRG
jgi:hypothetical protein